MSQTILIEPNEDLRKIYHLNLVTYTGSNIIERQDANDAIELLKILPNIDLIICSDHIGPEDTAKELLNFLTENNLEIPIICIGEPNGLADKVHIHKEKKNWEGLIKAASKSLGITEEDQLKKVRPDFIPIKIVYFYDIDHTPCDIYIRIKKTPIDFQYVKRIHAQDNLIANEIDRYLKQGLQELYISKDYQQYFVTFVTNTIMEKLELDLDIEDRILTNASAFEIAKEHIIEKSMSEEIEELTYSCIKSMARSIKESPELASLLQILFRSRISYAYQKAHLTCLVGHFIISKQKWYEERHLELFTYLSFLSDITLKSVEQLKVSAQDELDRAKLDKTEKEEVLNHALEASKLVSQMQGGSEYLELLVKQHQGSSTGTGFPKTYPQTLHPITKVFIIADNFVKLLLDPSRPKNKKEILAILYMRFETEDFQNIIKILEQKID